MCCPCRKKSETKTYAECCQPYHGGGRAALTAETLMRYSALAGAAQYSLLERHLASNNEATADPTHAGTGVGTASGTGDAGEW
jgi:uncharacterized protein YchJ